MVPFNEETGQIDEFWKLSFAKNDTPVQRDMIPWRHDRDTPETGESGNNPTPSSARRREDDVHLKVVWFDVLVAGEENLCDRGSIRSKLLSHSAEGEPGPFAVTYTERRSRLEQLVRPIYGFVSAFCSRWLFRKN